jgi:tetratricopeptide (TPR) repeat protein
VARYDRLGTLPLPARETAFPGWNALRDLAGRERDADVARRLRLHFLTLRPLRRLVAQGDAIDRASLVAQVERVREELGTLSTRDPQRLAVGELLTALHDPSRVVMAANVLSFAERALEWGHVAAADEYARIALELGRREASPLLESAALRFAGRVAAAQGRTDDARGLLEDAARIAGDADDLAAWANARIAATLLLADAGNAAAALADLAQIEARGRETGQAVVVATALEAASRIALASGSTERAAELAWRGVEHAETVARRIRLVELLGDALATIGRHDAADHAFGLAAAAAADSERVRLTARRARGKAESGDAEGFRLLSGNLPVAALTPLARLELARGALAAGEIEAARRYVAGANNSARSGLQGDVTRAAAALADEIERSAGRAGGTPVLAGIVSPPVAEIAELVLAVASIDHRA